MLVFETVGILFLFSTRAVAELTTSGVLLELSTATAGAGTRSSGRHLGMCGCDLRLVGVKSGEQKYPKEQVKAS